jgi:putative transposase
MPTELSPDGREEHTPPHNLRYIHAPTRCRLFPQDKARNANGLRRSLNKASAEPVATAPSSGVAPLLARLIERQTATGLPPVYLPKDEGDDA